MKKTTLLLVALSLLLAGCSAEPTLETRTFALDHMMGHEAEQLVAPYVYIDREGAEGTMSATDNALTVRETTDNLDRIARVLAEHDTPRPDVRLRFQLIEADGFTERDERIAHVEDELRTIFQFRGYRLLGEAVLAATDRSEVSQGLGPDHWVSAAVFLPSPGTVRLEEVELHSFGTQGEFLRTTVNARPGQTLVLGSASRRGEPGALLLTVTAEQVGG